MKRRPCIFLFSVAGRSYFQEKKQVKNLKDCKNLIYKNLFVKESCRPPLGLNFRNITNLYKLILLANLNFKS